MFQFFYSKLNYYHTLLLYILANFVFVLLHLTLSLQFVYNNNHYQNYKQLIEKGGRAGDCLACGQCESVCPQHLPIITLLQEASEKLDR